LNFQKQWQDPIIMLAITQETANQKNNIIIQAAESLQQ
jgi:hypothetical protein